MFFSFVYDIQIRIKLFYFFAFGHVPHLQEHQRKASHCVSFQHDRRIFPVPKTDLAVHIFIRQVDAAGKCHFAVDHHDFSVIAVVLMCGQSRPDR